MRARNCNAAGESEEECAGPGPGLVGGAERRSAEVDEAPERALVREREKKSEERLRSVRCCSVRSQK